MPIERTLKHNELGDAVKNAIDNSGLKRKAEGKTKQKEKMVLRSITLTQDDIEFLENYFNQKGLNFTAGARLVLKEFIEKQKKEDTNQ